MLFPLTPGTLINLCTVEKFSIDSFATDDDPCDIYLSCSHWEDDIVVRHDHPKYRKLVAWIESVTF